MALLGEYRPRAACTLCEQNGDLVKVRAGGVYSKYSSLKR